MAGRRLLPRAPLESPNPSGSWEEGESEGEEGVAHPEKYPPRLGRQNRSKLDPKIDQKIDVILVSFLVPLGSLLASLLDPFGRPNRLKRFQNTS